MRGLSVYGRCWAGMAGCGWCASACRAGGDAETEHIVNRVSGIAVVFVPLSAAKQRQRKKYDTKGNAKRRHDFFVDTDAEWAAPRARVGGFKCNMPRGLRSPCSHAGRKA